MINYFQKRKLMLLAQKKHFLPEINEYLLANQKFDDKQKISETRFVVFDTETTGLDSQKDQIIAISGISVQNFDVFLADSFETLINQNSSGTTESICVHELFVSDLLKGNTEPQAIIDFLKFIKNAVLVAQHASFDISMLNYALKKHWEIALLNQHIDTVFLAKKINMWQGNNFVLQNNYSLDKLCEKYEILIPKRHTASGDSLATALLFVKMLGIAEKKGVQMVTELLE
ncbi:MAG: 3'-5' exonuclease [Bacteroidetes bacterium]|nr:MAG: 3'-5' exonuclease [Bacteroidota bacterium]